MRALSFIALLLVVESRLLAADAIPTREVPALRSNPNTNQVTQSYISDYRGQPIW